jgi:hypothetical protein
MSRSPEPSTWPWASRGTTTVTFRSAPPSTSVLPLPPRRSTNSIPSRTCVRTSSMTLSPPLTVTEASSP